MHTHSRAHIALDIHESLEPLQFLHLSLYLYLSLSLSLYLSLVSLCLCLSLLSSGLRFPPPHLFSLTLVSHSLARSLALPSRVCT